MVTKTVKVDEQINANIKRIKDVAIEDLDNEDTTLIRTSNTVADLAALGEDYQADLANDADGTAIAAAVNGLRDVLIAAGLMDAS